MMIFVEDFLRVVEIGFLFADLSPRQTGQPVKVVGANAKATLRR